MAGLIGSDMGAGAAEAMARREEGLPGAMDEARRRCRALGLDAESAALAPITKRDRDIAKKNLKGSIAYTRVVNLGYLKSIDEVFRLWGGCALYLDHSLRVCGRRGDRALLTELEGRNIGFGTSFAEADAGMNAASLARELMCGCWLDGGESYLAALQPYACFAQAPISVGMDDFIVALGVFPQERLTPEARVVVRQLLLSLGIISRKNETLDAAASISLLDACMAHRGYSYVVVNENGRIVNIGADFLEKLRIQGGRTVGSRLAESLPGLSEAFEACRAMGDEVTERKVDGLELGGMPAWAFVTPLRCGNERMYALMVRSDLFEERLDRAMHAPRASADDFAGSSDAAASLRRRIESLAGLDEDVLVVGEHGSGRRSAARAIHDSSARAARPFVTCRCGALTMDHAARLLFGADDAHPGLFERARGGTLFLDGVEEAPAGVQAMLEAAIEDKVITHVDNAEARFCNVRIVISVDASSGLFERMRPGLRHRLPVAELRIAPLRDRVEDIPAAALSLLERCAASRRIVFDGAFSEGDFAFLQDGPWRGSARELRRAVEKTLVGATLEGRAKVGRAEVLEALRRETESYGGASGAVAAYSAPSHASEAPASAPLGGVSGEAGGSEQPYSVYEKSLLAETLRRHRGNKTAAAKELGMARSTLYARLRAYGLL